MPASFIYYPRSRFLSIVVAQYRGPIDDLLHLQDRMNRLFEDATHRHSTDGETSAVEQEIERPEWIPAADIYERDDLFELALDLPGIARDSLDISVERDSLIVRGTRSIENGSRRKNERPQGRFSRKFGLPALVDQSAISASYKDGELKVTLPKRKQPQAVRVEITVS